MASSASTMAATPAAAPGGVGPLARLRALAPMLLTVVFGVALVLGAIYAKAQLDQRDASITALEQTIDTLTTANTAFQEEVRRLGEERDAVSGQLGELQKRSADQEQALAASRQQLGQAQEASSRQQKRAEAAEAKGNAMAGIIQLDTQIVQELEVNQREITAFFQALEANDLTRAKAALQRFLESSQRLRELVQRRATMLRAVR